MRPIEKKIRDILNEYNDYKKDIPGLFIKLENYLSELQKESNLMQEMFKIVEAYCEQCNDKNCDCCKYMPIIHDYIEYVNE